MKKVQGIIKKLIFVISLYLLLFNTISCGIDNITVIDEPNTTIHIPLYSHSYDESYFSFWTNEINASSYLDCKYLGTDVYYKIYGSYSQMSNDISTLNTLANSETSSATAADKMIDKGYKSLKIQNSNQQVLVPAKNRNQRVYIRLTDYYDIEDYSARVLVDNENAGGLSERAIPVRNTDDLLSFNFGRSSLDGTKYKVPLSGDPDFSTSSSDGLYYVSLFAVAVGQDNTYTKIYSNILYLGTVTIDSNSFDN